MATKSAKKFWTKEIESDLIEEVRKREYLWNTKHDYYTKKTLKRVAYDEIAQILASRWPAYSMLFNTDIVMNKFGSLRSSYKRELKWTRILKSGSEGIGFVPKWIHYSSMAFLEDTVEAEDSISNLNCSQQTVMSTAEKDDYPVHSVEDDIPLYIDDEDYEQQIIDDEVVVPQYSTEPTPGCSKDPAPGCSKDSAPGCSKDPSPGSSKEPATPNNKKRKHDSESDLINEASKLIKKLNTTDAEDAYGQFVESMLKEIKDAHKRHKARIEIQQLLMKYIYE